MPTRGRGRQILVDTSVAVALSVADHDQHKRTAEALTGKVLGLSGHAAFESFSVLTRLPAPARRDAATVAALLARNFPASRFLSAEATGALVAELATLRIAGGAVYDALVGACANEHDLVLATRDRRALETYRALDVEIDFIA